MLGGQRLKGAASMILIGRKCGAHAPIGTYSACPVKNKTSSMSATGWPRRRGESNRAPLGEPSGSRSAD
jgi:hypothetical protein